MPVTVTCANPACGKTFQVQPSMVGKRTTCSNSCRSALRQAKRRGGVVALTCKRCGKTFYQLPSQVNSQAEPPEYCTRACYEAARREKGETAICEVCGKPYQRSLTHRQRVDLCGDKCRLVWRRKRERGLIPGPDLFDRAIKEDRRLTALARSRPIPTVCPRCGGPLVRARRYERGDGYVGLACRQMACGWEGEYWVGRAAITATG